MRILKGIPFERGRQEGVFYAERGVVFPPPLNLDLLAQQLAYYEKAAPERLEELRGIAAGSSSAFEAVAHRFLVDEILLIRAFSVGAQRSCSIGGITGPDGHLWIARNYDWQSVIAENVQLWRFEGPEGAVAIVSDMGILSDKDGIPSRQLFFPDDALNAHGLYIGLTFAYCWETGVGLATADVLRLVSARCKNVDEALAFFAENKVCCAKNFFLADRKKMAVVQHAQSAYEVHPPGPDGVLVVTNHYQGELKARENVPNVLPHVTTFERFTRLKADLTEAKGDLSLDRLDRIMTNNQTPVCQYFPEFGAETVWTLLGDPTNGNYRLITHPRSPQRKVTDFRVDLDQIAIT